MQQRRTSRYAFSDVEVCTQHLLPTCSAECLHHPPCWFHTCVSLVCTAPQILPGLARYEEVAAGAIRHALRFTVPQTSKSYVWPARHWASSSDDPSLPPMGLRVRLKAVRRAAAHARIQIATFRHRLVAETCDQTFDFASKRYSGMLETISHAALVLTVPAPECIHCVPLLVICQKSVWYCCLLFCRASTQACSGLKRRLSLKL